MIAFLRISSLLLLILCWNSAYLSDAADCSYLNGLNSVVVTNFTQLSCAFQAQVPNIAINASFSFPAEISITTGRFAVSGMNGAVLSSTISRLFAISSSAVNFSSLSFTGSASTADINGGLLYVSNSTIALQQMSLSSAAGTVGAAVYTTASSLSLTSTTISSCAANQGAIAAFHSVLSISSSSFTDNQSSGPAGAVFAAASALTIEGSAFQTNTATLGGAIMLNQCNATVSSSVFTANQAVTGGAVAMNRKVSASFQNTTFSSNIGDNEGGAIYALDNVNLVLTDVSMSNCSSGMGGGVYMSYASQLSALRWLATGNNAYYAGGVLSAYDDVAVSIKDSNMSSNSAGYGGVMALEYQVTANIDESSLSGNAGSTYGGVGYVISSSNVTLSECTVASNRARIGGGGFYLESSSTINLSNSDIYSNAASSGSAMYLQSSTANLTSCSVSDNGGTLVISLDGGAIYAAGSVLSSFATNYSSNMAAKGGTLSFVSTSWTSTADRITGSIAVLGGCVYAVDDALITMTQTVVSANNPTGTHAIAEQVYMDGGSLSLSGVLFEGNYVSSDAVFGLYSASLQVEGSNFVGNVANSAFGQGTVFYLACSQICVATTLTASISNSSFTNNSAVLGYGGAIYATAYPSPLTVADCTFTGNNASFGGAIVSYRGSQIAVTGSSFVENHATNGGGAIFWSNSESDTAAITTTDCEDISNTASYGPFQATTLTALAVSFANASYADSGHLLAPITVTFLDFYGQLVTKPSFDSFRPSIYADIYNNTGEVHGQTILDASTGTAVFNELVLTGTPGGRSTLTFETSLSTVDDVLLTIDFRTCVPGEVLTSSDDWFGCANCTLGTYSFEPTVACQVCPANVYCPGGAILNLDKDYWRESNITATIYQCPSLDSCLGGTDPANQCREGQSGPYCTVCDPGYTQDQNGQCYACGNSSSVGKAALSVLFLVLVLCIALFLKYRKKIVKLYNKLMKKASENFAKIAANRKFHTLRVKAKIVIAFVQIVYSIGPAMGIVFPSSYNSYLSYYSIVQLNVVRLPSVGCLVVANFYTELLIVTISPFLLFFLVAVTIQAVIISAERWNSRNPWYRRERGLRDTINAAFVISYFVLVDASVKIFQVFHCQTFDSGDSYLVADYSISCNAEDRSHYTTYGALMILVYPVGIPLAYAIVLFRNRKFINPDWKMVIDSSEKKFVSNRVIQKEKIKVRNTYEQIANISLLFDSYVPKRWYFELFDCVRRLLLGAIPVLVMQGSTLQVIMVLLVSLASVAVYMQFQPYIHVHDNQLAILTQWSITLVVIASLIIQVQAVSSGSDYKGLGVVMVLINVTVLSAAVVTVLVKSKEKKPGGGNEDDEEGGDDEEAKRGPTPAAKEDDEGDYGSDSEAEASSIDSDDEGPPVKNGKKGKGMIEMNPMHSKKKQEQPQAAPRPLSTSGVNHHDLAQALEDRPVSVGHSGHGSFSLQARRSNAGADSDDDA